jgi:hypothetical protein
MGVENLSRPTGTKLYEIKFWRQAHQAASAMMIRDGCHRKSATPTWEGGSGAQALALAIADPLEQEGRASTSWEADAALDTIAGGLVVADACRGAGEQGDAFVPFDGRFSSWRRR